MSSRHGLRVYDDSQHKKHHKHRKKHLIDDLHKKKHRNEQKENNAEKVKRTQHRNDYLENWLINFFKAYNEERNNNFSLEKNLKDKNLVKDNDLAVNVKEQHFLRGSYDGIEGKDFLRGSYDGIEEEDFLEESHASIEEKDFLEESHASIEDEDFLAESHDIIEKEASSETTYKKSANEYTITDCKSKVTSKMLPTCENIPYTSEVTVEPVTINVPVVLTECIVTIAVESSLKLEDTILEIKDIKKNVYLNQCQLVENHEPCKSNAGRLFLDGFIKSQIEYITNTHNDEAVTYHKIKHITVKVPFKCTTIAMFKVNPKFKESTYEDDTEILQTNIKVFDACGEEITGGDIREHAFKTFQFFNQKVFCELTSAEILEHSILENPVHKKCKITLEHGSHDITEKVVLLLTIKLLQNQHVEIPQKYEE